MLDETVQKQLKDIVGEHYFRTYQEALIAHSYDGTPMLQALPTA